LSAIATNEVLTDVTIEFYEPAANGTEALSSTIKLVNASVSDSSQSFSVLPGETLLQNIQNISMTFQKISITDKSGSTYSDDWQAQ
jgi:type VI secretion system Hcp family effector